MKMLRFSSNLTKKVSARACMMQTRTFSLISSPADSLYNGSNALYIDAIHQKWKIDPSTVHSSWDVYFKTGSYAAPSNAIGQAAIHSSTPIGASSTSSGSADASVTGVLNLIRAYQQHGHTIADLDPLKLLAPRVTAEHPELEASTYGLTDLNKVYDLASFGDSCGFLGGSGSLTLGQIIDLLKVTYSSTVGYEFSHCTIEEANWLKSKIEGPVQPLSKADKLRNVNRLAHATQFETFLKSKYNVKRFGVEGNESSIVALREIIKRSSDYGVESTVFGMPHRGRLNVLVNVIMKPLEIMFSEFAGNADAKEASLKTDGVFGSENDKFHITGDVKYHHGWSTVNELDNGKKMHCTLVPNPSHLETVNPLVLGKTRAKQKFAGDQNGSKVLPILLHGDAAFAGQGIVFESMAMHGLSDYSVGGTIHVVVNNQIGFTTDPFKSRSGPYSTDIAKGFQIPVFHVNADDVDAVTRVSALAAEYRAKFKKDVVLDIIGYRVNGHNELDQPSFTQPLMYQKIAAMPTTFEIYKNKVVSEGSITAEEVDTIEAKVGNILREKFDISRTYTEKPNDGQFLTHQWSKIAHPLEPAVVESTGLPMETLKSYGAQIAAIPEGFELHRGIANAYKDKAAAMATGAGLDWASCEALAFAATLAEGKPVRIAGQDAERGTFSHRHSVVHNQKTGEKYTPLLNLKDGNKDIAKFTVVNSLLSEYGALGYEYGYALEHPDQLNIWEAQFGDFVNGGQIIIDNYISGAEYKWNRQNGLVMLLPHGMEGQGPEHSNASGGVARFLALANDDPNFFPKTETDILARDQRHNWQVLNMTSAANYFHALRRQTKRNFRKPLVVMSPKSLLRHRGAAATFEDLAEGTAFRPVIGDAHVQDNQVKRHVICSGKVYFDVVDALEKAGVRDSVAVSRIEQISPFPFQEIKNEDSRYNNAEVVFVQEEHLNYGPYNYCAPRIQTALADRGNVNVRYIGRCPSAAPATGSGAVHTQELEAILSELVQF